MNDQQPYDPYDPYYAQQQPQIVGYDEYGQPVYQQQAQQQYDAYGQPQQGQAQGQGQTQGYDPYAQPQQPQQYDPYAQPQQQQGYGYQNDYGYDTGRQPAYDTGQQPAYDTGQQPAVVDTTQQWNIPHQQAGPSSVSGPAPAPGSGSVRAEERYDERQDNRQEERQDEPEQPVVPEQRRAPQDRAPQDRDYRTEQFAFIEEPDAESEDVIDWLAFTESRSERREEARRRGRSRVVALVVVLALVLVGGVGYLWYAGKLPGTGAADAKGSAAAGPQKRDVIVVHLHNTKKKGTSTALLVNNETTGQGTTVLLPNSLSVANDDGTTTTLGKSVDEDGSDGTREAIGTLLGTKVTGTWRLDTPYLDNLVELVGNVDVTTDVDVPDAKKGATPLVKKGENQTLSGNMAVAYATYLAPGEPEARQLQRFGQVLQAVLRKMSDDPKAATTTVETLAQILDPSLTEADLGASLAKLAEHAKEGDYKSAVLPVQPDGTLSEQASESVVKDILGGSVSAPEEGAAVRIGVKNASGDKDAAESARISLVNAGYSFVDAGTAAAVTSSQVTYATQENKAQAEEIAKTLGLPASAVKTGKADAKADVSVVLGGDYKAD
ncbi:LCP family protein [Streptomyces sp. NPDC088725]|uniref:LCP family protein n=1 Tax=Streptomyces sp. NPDC088725 TaxID=3365873 RepID=UPI003814A1C3